MIESHLSLCNLDACEQKDWQALKQSWQQIHSFHLLAQMGSVMHQLSLLQADRQHLELMSLSYLLDAQEPHQVQQRSPCGHSFGGISPSALESAVDLHLSTKPPKLDRLQLVAL
jgi:hypothetical protein